MDEYTEKTIKELMYIINSEAWLKYQEYLQKRLDALHKDGDFEEDATRSLINKGRAQEVRQMLDLRETVRQRAKELKENG